MRSGILCTDLQPHCVPFKGLWNGSIDAGRIMQILQIRNTPWTPVVCCIV